MEQSKLRTAFEGAVNATLDTKNLIASTAAVAIVTGVGAAFGAAALPLAAGAAMGTFGYQAAKGAYLALQNE